MLKGVAKSYEGKSEDEIFSDLSKKVQGAKRDGTLDDNKMSSIASTLAPMLTPEQRSKLNNLMKRLKN